MGDEWEFKSPAFSCVPDADFTLGPEVASLAEHVGLKPDPEQRKILDAVFSVAGDDLAAAYETVVIAPRQNLKTGVAKMAALGWLFVTGEKTVTWSAHEFSTALEAFNDLAEIIRTTPELRRRTRAQRRTSTAHRRRSVPLSLMTAPRCGPPMPRTRGR